MEEAVRDIQGVQTTFWLKMKLEIALIRSWKERDMKVSFDLDVRSQIKATWTKNSDEKANWIYEMSISKLEIELT